MNKILTILLFIHSLTFAQTDTTERSLEMNEIVVSSNKFEQLRRESPNQIELISRKQIAFQNAPNAANLLEQSGNVFVQRSQAGGGSPVLRGFEASRVLIVIDGVRMNNAIYRAGHLQNILRIDQSMLERAEVIFGPSSVMYGSDALGGVVNFRSRNPEFEKKNINAYVRYSSAFQEKTAHVDFNIGFKKIASLSSLTISEFGDLQMGKNFKKGYENFGLRDFYIKRTSGKDEMVVNDDKYSQTPSGYKQIDFLQKFIFKTKKITHILNGQISASSNVPRYDRLTEFGTNKILRFAEWYYGPEVRSMASYQLEFDKKRIFDKGTVIGAVQLISESRYSRRFNNQYRKGQDEFVAVYSINGDFQKTIKRNTINYGFEMTSNDVTSKARSTNIDNSSDSQKADTRYPDGGSQMNTYSIYLTDQFKISEKAFLNAGLRYNSSNLSAEFIEKTFFPFPFNTIEQKSGALTGNIGLVFNPSDKTKISVLGSSGYRTPNIDDLAKVFDSTPQTLVVPNPDLKPEYTYNGEATISQKIGNRIRIEGTYFYTSFRNAIVIDAFTLNGQSTVSYAGQNSKVVAAQNKAKALVRGWNINVFANLAKGLNLSSTLNQTKGNLVDDKDTPLDHVPPMFGRTALSYQKGKIQAEVFSIYNGWKKLAEYSPSGEDNLIYATPDGMPSWWTLNLRTGFQFNKNLSLQLACENILDKNYRNFASGISSAGRNFVITLRGGF
jgi:hemoglobin/transferrin/lactoferrin receptor protein